MTVPPSTAGANERARLGWLNELAPERAEAVLLGACASRTWAREMAARRPYDDPDALYAAADAVWEKLGADDWLEAFAAHPRIGERDQTKVDPQAGQEQEDGGHRQDVADHPLRLTAARPVRDRADPAGRAPARSPGSR